LPRPEVFRREVFVSSNARKLLPAEVLAHPAIAALIERGTPVGSVTTDDLRQASDDAQVEPRHLKALLGHLSGVGISVQIGVDTSRAVAAASGARKTTTAATAKKAAAKAPAASSAPATKKAAAKKAPAKKAAAKKKAPAKKAAAKKATD
jgi:RNA polymerase primary sigma factor